MRIDPPFRKRVLLSDMSQARQLGGVFGRATCSDEVFCTSWGLDLLFYHSIFYLSPGLIRVDSSHSPSSWINPSPTSHALHT